MNELTTAKQIIERLGGVTKVAELTGRKYGAAWNWLSFEKFPPDTFVVLQDALHERNCSAPASLWSMTERVSS